MIGGFTAVAYTDSLQTGIMLLGCGLMVMVGLVSMMTLPISQFPSVVPPEIRIQTTFFGADAETVQQSVATPIEQQMNGVDRMLYIQSTNANDGSMNQVVTFDVGTNIDIDNVLVNNRFSQAQLDVEARVKEEGSLEKATARYLYEAMRSAQSSAPQYSPLMMEIEEVLRRNGFSP
jgi:multidrug efflux pump subunit AcrB